MKDYCSWMFFATKIREKSDPSDVMTRPCLMTGLWSKIIFPSHKKDNNVCIIPFIIQTTKVFLYFLHFSDFMNCSEVKILVATVSTSVNGWLQEHSEGQDEFFLWKNTLSCSTYPKIPILLMLVLWGKEAITFYSGIFWFISVVSEKNTEKYIY